MKLCGSCGHEISADALSCSSCGVPFPAHEKGKGWGYEYKSETALFGLPLVHISFKYRPNRTPVVAKGIIAIGQFGCGVVTIAQFGIGVVTLGQFALAGFALAQFAVAYSLIAQFGLYVHEGHAQFIRSVSQLGGISF